MNGSNHNESQATAEMCLPNSNHLEAIGTYLQVSSLLNALGESLVTNPSMWPQLSSSLEYFFLLALLVRIGPGCAQTGSVYT